MEPVGRGVRFFDKHKWTVVPDSKLNIGVIGVKRLRRTIAPPTTHGIENRFSYDVAVRTEGYGLRDIVSEFKNFYGVWERKLREWLAVLKKKYVAQEQRRESVARMTLSNVSSAT